MDALELPGDRWNNDPRFIKCVLEKAIEIEKPFKSWKISKIIREVYEQIKNEIDFEFYPEQFDITFDFVRKMCEEKFCDICILGKKGAKLICIPNEKYCTVSLITCGYLAPCEREKYIFSTLLAEGWSEEKSRIYKGA